MPANAVLTTSATWLDSVSGYMVPSFYTAGGVQSGPHWTCTKLTQRLGNQPSHALIRIPLAAAVDETAPTVAGVPNGPLTGIKIGTPCIIRGYGGVSGGAGDPGTLLLAGTVVDVTPEIGPEQDHAIVEVIDDRYVLEAMQVIGSFWINSDATPRYRQGWPAHFNPGGMPNCTLCAVGSEGSYMPVFCPPNFNLSDGETVPGTDSTEVQSGIKATYWTIDLILKYLRWIVSTDIAARVSAFKWYPQLPEFIEWRADYASAIESGDKEFFNGAANNSAALGARKGREMVLEGMTILAALNEVVGAAGPYAVYLQPQVGGSFYINQVQIVKARYSGGGIDISRPTSGNAADRLNSQKLVVTASLKESGRNLYTMAAIAGALVYIERRVYSQTTDNDSDGTRGLKKAWTATLLTALQDEIKAALNASTYSTAEEAFQALVRKPQYWKVCAAYRISEDYNFMLGTSESGLPLCEMGRPILPHQLTSSLEGAAGDTYSRLSARAPIPVEISANGTFTDMALPDSNDGLTLDADGTIWLTGLRSQSKTYTIAVTGTAPSVSAVAITPYALRMNVAIPCDHRIVDAMKIPTDQTANVTEVGNLNDDADRIDTTLSRLYYADAGALYSKEIRGSPTVPDAARKSWPTPESVASTNAYDDKILRNDIFYLRDALKRRLADIGRVERSGRLVIPHLCFGMPIGTAIRDLANSSGANFPVRGIIYEITYNANGDETQWTELGLK